MTEWFDGYVLGDVARLHRLFNEARVEIERTEQLARARGSQLRFAASLAQIDRAYRAWQRGLNSIAERYAAETTRAARSILATTNRRDDTRTAPHLRDLIYCAPLRTPLPAGAVGVGRISTLERARNPRTPGYGSYWRAQEFGTGAAAGPHGIAVPSQIGRQLRGFFYRAGVVDPTRPQAQYAGAGDPAFPIFVPGRPGNLPASVAGGIGPRGGIGGKGVIHHEIRGRHFLTGATRIVGARYVLAMRGLEQTTVAELGSIIAAGAGRGRR